MPATRESALDESGLSIDIAAESIARVFGAVVGVESAGDPVGWIAVVRGAEEAVGPDDEKDFALAIPDFANHLRIIYGVALDPDYTAVDAAVLPPIMRLAWEAVTRHLLNLFAFDNQEARKLDQHEAQIVKFILGRATATPK